MIHVAIVVLCFLLLVGLVFWVLSQIPGIPDPIRRVVYIILVVICVLIAVGWLLNFSGDMGSFSYRPRA